MAARVHYPKGRTKTLALCGLKHGDKVSSKWGKVTCASCNKLKESTKTSPSNAGRKPKWKPEYAQLIHSLLVAGYSELEVARELGVVYKTLWEWKTTKPELSNVVELAKKEALNKVVRSLYEKATGYSHKETKVFQYQGKVITKDMTKHYPPDTSAIQYYLNNRDPDNWKRDGADEQSSDDMPDGVELVDYGESDYPEGEENPYSYD